MRLSALIPTVVVVVSFASESQSAAADAPSWPSGTCVSRDVHYTTGNVICIAPHFGQICNKEGVWDPPTNAAPLQDVCATAQIPTNPAPSTPPPSPACTYLGIQYSLGSTFCVAPHLAQKCVLSSDIQSRSDIDSRSSIEERRGKEVQWILVQDPPPETHVVGPKEGDLFFKWCANAQIPNPGPGAPPPSPPSAK